MSIKIIHKKKTHKCDKCEKYFSSNRYLNLHLQKEIPCTKKFKCTNCGLEFTAKSLLTKHLNRITPCMTDSIPVIKSDNPENRCKYCNKTYSTKGNLKRHMKSCQPDVDHLMKLLDKQDEKIAKLESTKDNVTNYFNNTINMQNNMQVNIVVCGFGKEDLSTLDYQKIKELIINQATEFIPLMIKDIHNNPDRPEFGNIFYNCDSGQVVIFTNDDDNSYTWKLEDATKVSKQLTQKIKRHVINNPTLTSLFPSADDDEDWEKFAKGIKVIHSVDGEELKKENMEALKSVNQAEDPEVLKLIS